MSNNDESFAPDTVFDRYVIVRRIGAGGMGAVYEARHTDLQKRVALKTLHASVASNPEIRARFIREGQAATRIRHPHVVDVSDVGISAGIPYMVMEFLEGEDLSQSIERQGALAVEQMVAIMLPVVSAVAAAHDASIVHRDLKPENIFLAKTRHGAVHPKLLDFGISKITDGQNEMNLTGTGLLMGTPYYMSPEQTRGSKAVGPRADLYALGVILYQSLTAQRPFDGETLFSVLDGIVNGRYTPLREVRPEIPGALEYVVHRAMDKEPDARFQTASALGRALFPFGSAATRAQWEGEFGGASDGDLGTQATEMSAGPADASMRVAALAAITSAGAVPPSAPNAPQPNTLHQGATELPLRQTLAPGRAGRGPLWAGIAVVVLVGAVSATWMLSRGRHADDVTSTTATRRGPTPPVVVPGTVPPTVPAVVVPPPSVPSGTGALPPPVVPTAVPGTVVPTPLPGLVAQPQVPTPPPGTVGSPLVPTLPPATGTQPSTPTSPPGTIPPRVVGSPNPPPTGTERHPAPVQPPGTRRPTVRHVGTNGAPIVN